MINLNDPPKYMKDTITGRIHAFNPHAAKLPQMEPYSGPLPGQKAVVEEKPKTPVEQAVGKQVVIPDPLTAEERMAKIKEAIPKIPKERWTKPLMGNPSMPKINDLRGLCGFKVTIDELKAAME